jgi:predicted RND superfamily exporter protein
VSNVCYKKNGRLFKPFISSNLVFSQKKHKNWIPSECSQKSLLNIVFTKYAKLLITIYFKVIMIILTLSLVGLSAYGVSQLKAEFNFNVFLNEGTYLREYVDVNEEKFPNGGIYGEIYVAEKPNFHQDMEQILAMLNE